MNALRSLLAAVTGGFRTLWPTCREAARLQSQSIDGVLPLYRRPGLWFHRMICRWCRRYGQQLRFLHRIAHDHPEALHQANPRPLSPEAKARLKSTLKQAGGS